MSSRIHPQARTTPKVRQEIKDSGLSDRQAAKVFAGHGWVGRCRGVIDRQARRV